MSNLSEIDFSLPPEQQAIRDKCFHPSGMFVEFPIEDVESSIPARFEKIVRMYPDRLAIKMGDRVLTYQELNQAANRVAWALLEKHGPVSEGVVLLFEHGIEVITAILGVLKAGKGYVVVDASFPSQRIEQIIENCRASVFLTCDRHADLARPFSDRGCAGININQLDTFIAHDKDPTNLISAGSLASILYTSGSTGRPKGIAHSHRSQLHTVMINTNEARICYEDRLTLIHSVGFGSAQAHLFQALLNGACLYLFDLKSEGIHRLVKWLNQEGITVYHSPPAVLRQLAQAMPVAATLDHLRLIRLSGAAVTCLDHDLYKNTFAPSALLQVVMNSTEANVICSFFSDGSFSFPESGWPAGYPVQDKKIHLLDEDGGEVVARETGEFAIRSAYLPVGSWDDLDPKAIQMGVDPINRGERTILTGDIGRQLSDGLLVFLGRKDSMVKIRGYRVDLGEIERVLQAHPGIKEAAVVAWDSESGDKYLAAYIVAHEPTPPASDELYAFLQTKLPHYMMPASFVFIEVLPLINGKLDRRGLPWPGRTRPDLGQAYVPAQTATEARLIQIWQELLEVAPIGVHDNFFYLGGHSLLASRFVSRVHQGFHLELPLRSVFELPTVAGLARWIDTHRDAAQDARALSVTPVPRGAELPLSFAQEGLWFLDQLAPEGCAYNLSAVFELTGSVDADALQRSLDALAERHEALRTVFKSVDGQPLQVILPSMAIPLAVVDLRRLATRAEQESEIRRLRKQELLRSFDLSQGPLLRMSVLTLAEDHYVLLLIIHHIIFDRWSTSILARELSVLYDSFSSGKPAALPDLPVQVADFAVWQRKRYRSEWLDAQLSYWKRQLGEIPPLLELPVDRPRPAVQTYRGQSQSFSVPQRLVNGLIELARENDATLYMTLLAAYQVLLHRYTQQNNIVVGVPVAGRTVKEVEGLIGYFVNLLPLRVDLSRNPTARELLVRVRETCLEAYEHQDLPFEKLVEALQPERSLAYHPLVQATFALQNTPRAPLAFDGKIAADFDTGGAIARFDLHLYVIEVDDGLECRINYNNDLFDAATITRMMGHFQNLLEGLVANPDARLSDLPLLTQAERQQLLVEWNNTSRTYPDNKCVHRLFEEQAEKAPNAIAVVFGEQQLTYRELNDSADRLADYLQTLGIGPDSLVGLCADRSLDLIVGMIGILKAGGAYVPLDPNLPKDRLAFMVADANIAIILTQRQLREQLSDGKVQLIFLDDQESFRSATETPRVGTSNPNHLAYVIYTSGSTGVPKGALVTHANLARLFQATAQHFYFDASDAWTLFHSYAFDFSVWEIWGALLHGGRLVIVPYAISRAPDDFAQLIKQQGVTVLNQTPSAFQQLMPYLMSVYGGDKPALRYIVFGGEALELESLRAWRDRHGDQQPRLVNMYGITESTVHVTYRPIALADLKTNLGSPIGRPLADLSVYLLDGHRQLVPVGVAGEVYVGGAGVARGYLNRPELTAEKFVYHSFDGEPARRLYRTGDLARYLPDGNLEFLGRIDNQVKIRGYRIELGEIESVLMQHADVRECVVVARDDRESDSDHPKAAPQTQIANPKSLVAYVVSQIEAPATSELRAYLKGKLPDYMVPSAFVFLDALPLTPNGKVDRKALPDPGDDQNELAGTFVDPRNGVEESIAAVWREILGKSQISVHDNFFDVGGHSLKATQVVSRLRTKFGVEIPLRHIFEYRTIEELAVAIGSQRDADSSHVECLLRQIEALTEEEARQQLASESTKGSSEDPRG